MKKYLLKKILDELMHMNSHLDDSHNRCDDCNNCSCQDVPWEKECDQKICQCKRNNHEKRD